jgi:hypothetical protein
VLDIGIPRPRTLGHNAHQDEVAQASAELHELLIEPPSHQRPQAPEPTGFDQHYRVPVQPGEEPDLPERVGGGFGR